DLGGGMASAPRQNGSHGAKGSQRHRALVHHLPLAIGSVGLLALFTVLPLFDVSAYGHVDVMTGTFPQARADASGAAVDAHGQAHSRRTVHVGRTDHGSERQTTMGHGRDVRTAELRSMPHGEVRQGASDNGGGVTHGDRQQSASLSRGVQQLTVATGYVGVGLLAVTLLLGPANLLLGRRNPESTYFRRDVGIWTAFFSVVHVILAVAIHVSHGSGVVKSILHFFVAEDGTPLTNSFGWGNWTGLAALAIVLGLLATSSDAALRLLKPRPWKWLQRLAYVLFVLVVLHAVFYGAL